MFLWLTGRSDKAREYTDRLIKMAPSSSEAMALKGWIDLTSGREALAKKSLQFFEKSLSGYLLIDTHMYMYMNQKQNLHGPKTKNQFIYAFLWEKVVAAIYVLEAGSIILEKVWYTMILRLLIETSPCRKASSLASFSLYQSLCNEIEPFFFLQFTAVWTVGS